MPDRENHRNPLCVYCGAPRPAVQPWCPLCGRPWIDIQLGSIDVSTKAPDRDAHTPLDRPSLPLALALVSAVAAVVGALWAYSPAAAAIATGAVIIVVLLLVAPWIVLAMVLPAAFITYRLGAVGSGLSVADMALIVGVLAALIFLPRPGDEVRKQLLIAVAFLAVLLIPTLATPTTAALVEWGHRLLLVAGSLLVGATLVAMGQSRRALRLFLLAAVVVGVAAVVTSVATGFEPAYPIGFNKNLAGGLLGLAVLLMAAAPGQLAFSPRILAATASIIVLGLIATQSRGAILALVPGLLYVAWRRGLAGGSWRLLIPLVAVLAGFSVFTLWAETLVDEGQSSNINTRLAFQQVAVDFWLEEPILGQGIRYYFDESFGFPRPPIEGLPGGGDPHPHNIVTETLSESGVVGMIAFVILTGGTLVLVGKRRSGLAIAAGAMIVTSTAHGLVDIYWEAGLRAIPWIIVGMSAALADVSIRSNGSKTEPADQSETVTA